MFKYGICSGPYFSTFGLNTERHGVSLHIQSECGKIRKKTPYLDTFHAVRNAPKLLPVYTIILSPPTYLLSDMRLLQNRQTRFCNIHKSESKDRGTEDV